MSIDASAKREDRVDIQLATDGGINSAVFLSEIQIPQVLIRIIFRYLLDRDANSLGCTCRNMSRINREDKNIKIQIADGNSNKILENFKKVLKMSVLENNSSAIASFDKNGRLLSLSNGSGFYFDDYNISINFSAHNAIGTYSITFDEEAKNLYDRVLRRKKLIFELHLLKKLEAEFNQKKRAFEQRISFKVHMWNDKENIANEKTMLYLAPELRSDYLRDLAFLTMHKVIEKANDFHARIT